MPSKSTVSFLLPTSRTETFGSIDILLATYNGAAWLRPQIESLLAQDYPVFRVLVSDDGSNDDTVQILREYERRAPGRFLLTPTSTPGQGAKRNFEHLMQCCLAQGQARWFAFADQDDVWSPGKLSLCAAHMLSLEAKAGPAAPCLVHTDLQVVDSRGRLIHPSLARYEGLDPAVATRESLLSVNEVTGCTVLGNRRLLELALPFPQAAIMHDWWCAVIAGSGARVYVAQPTVYYRQHAANQIGARNRSLWSRADRLWHDAPGVWHWIRQLGELTWHQAQALRQRLHEQGLDDRYVVDYLSWRAAPKIVQLPWYRRYYAGPELDRLSRWCLWRQPTPIPGT